MEVVETISETEVFRKNLMISCMDHTYEASKMLDRPNWIICWNDHRAQTMKRASGKDGSLKKNYHNTLCGWWSEVATCYLWCVALEETWHHHVWRITTHTDLWKNWFYYWKTRDVWRNIKMSWATHGRLMCFTASNSLGANRTIIRSRVE